MNAQMSRGISKCIMMFFLYVALFPSFPLPLLLGNNHFITWDKYECWCNFMYKVKLNYFFKIFFIKLNVLKKILVHCISYFNINKWKNFWSYILSCFIQLMHSNLKIDLLGFGWSLYIFFSYTISLNYH